jgi:hypothetical protein
VLRFPPHLNPLPPGARKEKKKMRFSGLQGVRGRGGEIFELKKRVVLQDFI